MKLKRAPYVGGGIVAVGALAFAGTSIASALSSGSNFRTAHAELASVSETVEVSGSIASASRYDLAFQTGGTVASVQVSLGDTVAAGQILATLDEAELAEAVAEAEQTVTNAQQTLAEHEESQSSGSSSSSTSSSTTSIDTSTAAGGSSGGSIGGTGGTSGGSSGGSGSSTPNEAVTEAAAKVTAAQQAMLAKYAEVQTVLDETNGIIASATDTCQIFLNAVLTDDDGGEQAAADGEPAEADSGAEGEPDIDPAVAVGMSLEEAQAALEACQDTIADVQQGQSSVRDGQQQVQDLAASLNTAVEELLSAATGNSSETNNASGNANGSGTAGSDTAAGTSGTGASGAESGASATSTTGTPAASSGVASTSGSGSMGASTTITAEQLLADQAAINVAEAELKIAQAQLKFSSLTSPIAGEVVSVAIAAGDSVTAASESATITVIGEDGYVAETTVSLTDISKLEIGQSVDAVVTSTGQNYSGEVTSIGVLNVSTTSTPAFDVIVALDTADAVLLNGGSVRLSVSTAEVADALTVPSSAVHLDGNTAVVNVLRGGESTPVEVELGAVGAERSEILSGLEEGDRVILADLSQAIDSGEDSSSSSSGLAGLASGGAGGMGSAGGGSFPDGGAGRPSMPGGGFGG